MFAHLFITALTAAHIWLAPATPGAPAVVADAGELAAAERTTDNARTRVRATSRALARARRVKAQLSRIYQNQLAQIDRLKQRRASWRRDRMLRSQLSESLETSKKLTAAEKRIRALRERLTARHKALFEAVDAELALGPADERSRELRRLRRKLLSQLRPQAQKIVIPDLHIDRLADPEELEYQAAAIQQTEKELIQEMAALRARAGRYTRMTELRRKRARAEELDRTDDDRPRRSTGRVGDGRGGGGAGADEGAADPGAPQNEDSGSPDDGTSGDPADFDGDPTVVLADVVDSGTLDALRAAERSGNPAVKARAAKRALEQVRKKKRRLEKVREKIEQRAKRLRRR